MPDRATLVLRPEPEPIRVLASRLWAARGLVGVLARKDFLARYRRASLGLAWAVGLPVLQAVVLAVVFDRFVSVGVRSYPLFVLAGMVGWTYFFSTLGPSSTAIVDGSALTSRIYFPRAVLPLATVAANLYGLAITLAVLLVAAAVAGMLPAPEVVLVLPAAALLVALTAALGLCASALHVYVRDVRYVVQAGLTVWFYVTPVILPVSAYPQSLHAWVRANPVTGPVELFRAATVGASPGFGWSVAAAVAWTLALAAVAVAAHRRHDRLFADRL